MESTRPESDTTCEARGRFRISRTLLFLVALAAPAVFANGGCGDVESNADAGNPTTDAGDPPTDAEYAHDAGCMPGVFGSSSFGSACFGG